ncbi:hypothetical protein GQ53DRAFT_56263 [Thozetella sp. PMI_491]|nr:hypothetical protein GQ53DRAFT_56263 [Thozetella sp. PMI_491]
MNPRDGYPERRQKLNQLKLSLFYADLLLTYNISRNSDQAGADPGKSMRRSNMKCGAGLDAVTVVREAILMGGLGEENRAFFLFGIELRLSPWRINSLRRHDSLSTVSGQHLGAAFVCLILTLSFTFAIPL